MNRLLQKLLLTGYAATLFATPSIAFEELGKIKMPAAEQYPPVVPGTTVHQLKNGEPYSYTFLTLEEGVYTGEDSEGCKFSGLDGTWGPSLSWENCGGNAGSHNITRIKGSPWPMNVKKKFSFNFKGINSKGDTWTGYRKCKVKSAVRVKVPAGEFDTYKIVCGVDWEIKTYWYAPELGFSAAIKRHHKNNSSKSYLSELVKIETP